MKSDGLSRLWSADATSGVVLIGISAYLLSDALKMPGASGMLPVFMLVLSILLSVILVAGSVRRRLNGAEAKAFFHDRKRFLIAATLVCVYIPCVDFLGFYTSSTILIPLTSWLFGYRNVKVIAAATVGFVGGMLAIFTLVMSANFPAEFFLR